MLSYYLHCLILSLFLVRAKAIIYVNSSSLPSNITTDCLAALTNDIACDDTIRKLRPGLYYPESALTTICTSSCNLALNAFENTVTSACVGETYDSMTDIGFIPIYTIPDVLRYNFNLSCLSSEGQFCNVQAALDAGIASDQSNLNNASDTGSDTDSCSDCSLMILQFEASSPYYSDDDIVSIYSSKTSSCSATQYPLSTSTFAFSVPVPTTTLVPCMGETYNIQPDDTCESVSKNQGTGTSWLLSDNNLAANCADFPNNGSLCLGYTCNTYTVQENDTCTSIAVANEITYAQVLAWNPNFDLQCSNINKTIGFEICIGAPGTQYIPPTASFVPTVAVTAAAIPTNAAVGTNKDCGQWYEALPGDFCELLVIKYAISLQDFLFLNSGVNNNCTNLFAFESYCVEPVGDISDYPGAPGFVNPTPTSNMSMIPFSSLPDATFIPALFNQTSLNYANGTRTDCEIYIQGSDYQMNITGTFYSNNCQLVLNVFDLDVTIFNFLNPSLDASSPDCSLNPSLSYCILWSGAFPTPAPSTSPVPYPIRDGTTTECDQYGSVYPGMTCAELLVDYCITIAQFFSWNPEVGSDCIGLESGFQYCMAGTGFAASSCSVNSFPASMQTGPTTTLPTPPGPTQSGEPSDCNQWYLVKSGDSCGLVESMFDITSTQFLSWNPAISSDCSTGFNAGDAYCVGISSGTPTSATPPGPTQSGEPANCNKWYLAQSGDSCSAIESSFSITSAQFLAWNPAVSSDCSTGFDAGLAYCVGVSSATSPTTSSPSTVSSTAAIPSPTQVDSIISTCNKYAITVSGDGCSSFAEEHGITTTELFAWNTVLGENGANCATELFLGFYYCVGVSS